MNITERAAKVLQEIDAALAAAENATAGPWIKGDTCVGIPAVFRDSYAVCLFQIRGNAESFTLPNSKADATFIAASRTGWPTALRCLKTAIEALLEISLSTVQSAKLHPLDATTDVGPTPDASAALYTLTTLCDQWEGIKYTLTTLCDQWEGIK